MRAQSIGLLVLLLLVGCRGNVYVLQPIKPPASSPAPPGTAATPTPPSRPNAPLLNHDRTLLQLVAPEKLDKKQIALKVEKSLYRLTVLYRGKAIKSYPVVLGGNPVDDKRREGDSCTPEGEFALQDLHPHRSWSKFMLINYPTAESWRRFRAAKKQGLIPQDATIGGAVGIHGVPDKDDAIIDQGANWTLGCVSLKTADIEELYSVCRVGTHVTIMH